MTSILKNTSASTALQTLRQINSGLNKTEARVSSGLRIATASDNAAYWAIATTMRSDNKAVSAVSDALGLSAAKLDTAYHGVDQVIDIVGDMKAKLVAAKEAGTDKAKIQTDLDQLKQQVQTVVKASTYNGVSYLDTDIEDIYDTADSMTSVTAAFVRDADNNVSIVTADFDLAQVSLFNSTGGGILQADPRYLGTIGGLRYASYYDDNEVMSTSSAGNTGGTPATGFIFHFTGPMDFGAGDEISFDVTVDADNPADGIPGPYDLGTTAHVKIDQSTVNQALGVLDGHIETYVDYTAVINYALQAVGANARAGNFVHPDPPNQNVILVPTIDDIGIFRVADASKDGSSFKISNLQTTIAGNGGFHDTGGTVFGHRSSSMTLDFEPFRVAQGVVVSLHFGVDGDGSDFIFDKDYVDTLLGKTTGKVETAEEMATLLNSFVTRPDVIIEDNGSGGVSVRTDVLQNRKSGEKSAIGFTGISVNIEPIPRLNFMDIDIVQNPKLVGTYISYLETVTHRLTGAASVLGSMSKRVEIQSSFAHALHDSIESGIGRLVDADMEEESSRLSAQQSQQQLAIQSLSIANSAPKNILSLFQ
ncbi:flagellin [Rhizobium sp. S152]|nr:flagellin [Rhizobium sp. S152]MDM9626851.1 flagellin [Rhizobium sp. S152]